MIKPRYKFKTKELHLAMGIPQHQTLYTRIPKMHLPLLEDKRDKYVLDIDVMKVVNYYLGKQIKNMPQMKAFGQQFEASNYKEAGVTAYQLTPSDIEQWESTNLVPALVDELNGGDTLVASPKTATKPTKVVSSINGHATKSTNLGAKMPTENKTITRIIKRPVVSTIATSTIKPQTVKETLIDRKITPETNLEAPKTPKPMQLSQLTKPTKVVEAPTKPTKVVSPELTKPTKINDELTKPTNLGGSELTKPTKVTNATKFSLVSWLWNLVDSQILKPAYLILTNLSFRFVLAMIPITLQSLHLAKLFQTAGEIWMSSYLLGFTFELTALVLTVNNSKKNKNTILMFSAFAFVVNLFFYDVFSHFVLAEDESFQFMVFFTKILMSGVLFILLYSLTKLFARDYHGIKN